MPDNRFLAFILTLLLIATASANSTEVTYGGTGTFVNVDAANPWGAPAGGVSLDFFGKFWFLLPSNSTENAPDDPEHASWNNVTGAASITAFGNTVEFAGPTSISIWADDNSTIFFNFSGLYLSFEGWEDFKPFTTDNASNLLNLDIAINYTTYGETYNDIDRFHLLSVETVPEGGATLGMLALALTACLVARKRR